MKSVFFLHGHERAITQIKYNFEGDLLFTASKDKEPNVWYSVNGERLGSYKGHQGGVWTIDVSWDSRHLISGAGDCNCILWDCERGTIINTFLRGSPVRSCGFGYSGNLMACVTDKAMNHNSELWIHDIRASPETEVARMGITPAMAAGRCMVWGPLDETVVTGHQDGWIVQWDIREGGRILNKKDFHDKQVNDIQMNKDMTLLVSASLDNTAKLIDLESFEHVKTYKTDRPVNSAAISPLHDYVLVGGGQEAMRVTTTSAQQGKFDAKFFHMIYEDQFASVKDHFGPINSVAFHPDGKSYTSGGEDGYARVHYFGDDYLKYDFDY